ncbi:MAG TPA: heavy-metal-associated domain-containing protein [Lacibacter sp.]|nr:heavy-metal-associated domain-containing protein [Lacibacter sp.]HMO90397.1 heavy-metal-associated domain-containing protein [Lacibacter sp.]HMP87541.1 heavy-metal-associated domain-containing protein [Lacibacter sp.]
MNRIILVLLLTGLYLGVTAQATFRKPLVAQIKTPQAQCVECKDKIEKFMKYEEGVAKVVVDIRKKITTITFLGDRTNIENLKTALANLGFDADDVTANEATYKRLPLCCKREADGGGPPKKQ